MLEDVTHVVMDHVMCANVRGTKFINDVGGCGAKDFCLNPEKYG